MKETTMKTTKEILENVIDALLDAEPILRDSIREPMIKAREKLNEINNLTKELAEP